MAATIDIVIKGSNQASTVTGEVRRDLQGLGDTAESSGSRVGGFFTNAFAFATGGVITSGIGSIVGGLTGAVSAGFGFNNSMEQVTAKLNAFTKDGAKSAEILQMIKDRAAQTPFEFDAMANAAAGLLPASKASGIGLEELIGKAEILAASNPAEGLEGAAFALKEAVSGDFTSIIERFNLPRSYLNELKAQGVPAVEAVGMAMQQLGLDSSLVANMAQTAEGRWSTLKDTFTNVAASVTGPLFTAFSNGLGQLQPLLDANAAKIGAVATAIGVGLGTAFSWMIGTGVPGLVGAWNTISPAVGMVVAVIGSLIAIFTSAGNSSVATSAIFGSSWAEIQAVISAVVPIVQGIIQTGFGIVQSFIQQHGGQIQAFFTSAWTQVQQIVQLAAQFYQAVIVPALAGVAGFIAAHKEQIVGILSGAWQVISSVIQTVLGVIRGVIQLFTGLFTGDWNTAWQGIQTITSSIWNGIQGVVQGAMTLLKGAIQIGLDAVKGIWSAALNNLVSLVTGIGGSLASAGRGIVDNIKSGIEAAWGGLVSWFQGKLQELRDNLPFSPPRDPRSPLRDLPKAGATIVSMLQDGITGAGRLQIDAPMIGQATLNSGRVSGVVLPGSSRGSALGGSAAPGATAGTVNNYYINGQQVARDTQSLVDTVRLTQMLGMAT